MKVSVIIPIYNCASYISDCIASLKSQTFSDFEVLLVDDHGQDRSIDVAKLCVEGDTRFRFLETSKNSGPGIARNVGIDAAKGDYISFIDSDDIIDNTFLEKLYNAVDEDRDLSYCQLKYQGGKKDGLIHRNPILNSTEISASERKTFLSHFVTFSVCFMYRREFLDENNLRFPSLRNSEDTNFLTRNLLLAKSIACVDEPLYTYCIREQSLTTGLNPHKAKERIQALNLLMSDFKEMKKNDKYATLNLGQYEGVMKLIWLKKGLAQSILEIIKLLK